MKRILLASFGMMSWTIDAKADPVVWMDRCLQEAANQKNDAVKHDRIDAAHCARTILNYCTFDVTSNVCFKTLQTEYDARSESLLSAMPTSIEAAEVLQKLYLKRLNVVQNILKVLICTSPKSQQTCDAEHALQRYQLAQTLPKFIANMEDQK